MLPCLCSNLLRVSLLNLRYQYLEIGIFEPCKYKPYVVFETVICNTCMRLPTGSCALHVSFGLCFHVCFENVAAHLMFDLLVPGQECSAWCSMDTVQVTLIVRFCYLWLHVSTVVFHCLVSAATAGATTYAPWVVQAVCLPRLTVLTQSYHFSLLLFRVQC
jgi:hypothetical protein